MNATGALLRRLGRMILVVVLVVVGSTALVRFAPGYLSDAREMDARYAGAARNEMAVEAARSVSMKEMLVTEAKGWLRWDLGISRQYEIPVIELIQPRLAVTARLLLQSIVLAWFFAISAAIIANTSRHFGQLSRTSSTILLAIPTGAMATLCLLADSGGPLLVMTTLLAVRDFKFVDRMLEKTWRDPHLLHARAQGIPPAQLLWVHLLPTVTPQLASLATLSILTALGAIVPVEVIFSTPGVGQLAWNAAMNRDLPVLLAVTMLMAILVTASGFGTNSKRVEEWKTI